MPKLHVQSRWYLQYLSSMERMNKTWWSSTFVEVGSNFGLVFIADNNNIRVPDIKFFIYIYNLKGTCPNPQKVEVIHCQPAPWKPKWAAAIPRPCSTRVSLYAKVFSRLNGHPAWAFTRGQGATFENLMKQITLDCNLTYFDSSEIL